MVDLGRGQISRLFIKINLHAHLFEFWLWEVSVIYWERNPKLTDLAHSEQTSIQSILPNTVAYCHAIVCYAQV